MACRDCGLKLFEVSAAVAAFITMCQEATDEPLQTHECRGLDLPQNIVKSRKYAFERLGTVAQLHCECYEYQPY